MIVLWHGMHAWRKALVGIRNIASRKPRCIDMVKLENTNQSQKEGKRNWATRCGTYTTDDTSQGIIVMLFWYNQEMGSGAGRNMILMSEEGDEDMMIMYLLQCSLSEALNQLGLPARDRQVPLFQFLLQVHHSQTREAGHPFLGHLSPPLRTCTSQFSTHTTGHYSSHTSELREFPFFW